MYYILYIHIYVYTQKLHTYAYIKHQFTNNSISLFLVLNGINKTSLHFTSLTQYYLEISFIG